MKNGNDKGGRGFAFIGTELPLKSFEGDCAEFS